MQTYQRGAYGYSPLSSNRHLRCGKSILILVNCFFSFFFFLLLLCLLCFVEKSSSQSTDIDSQEESPITIPLTKRSDKKALLRIKRWANQTEGTVGLLEEWQKDKDPCRDGWPHILCNCAELSYVDPELSQACDNFSVSPNVSRVITLILRGRSLTTEKLSGTIPDAFGGLTKLRILDLSDNRLHGTIPKSFARLRHLRWLDLNDNQLDGTIPSFFGNYSKLITLDLGKNNFSGPVPEDLCDLNETSSSITLTENDGLCGELDVCLVPFIKNINDTHIQSEEIDPSKKGPYKCDETKPYCSEQEGCRIEVPRYWTSRGIIEFNYTNFTDPETGIAEHVVTLVPVFDEDPNVIEDTAPESIKLSNITYWYPNIASNQNLNTTSNHNVNTTSDQNLNVASNQNITVTLNQDLNVTLNQDLNVTSNQSLKGTSSLEINVTLNHTENTSSLAIWNYVKHCLGTTSQLVDGKRYVVRIQARNEAGPQLMSDPKESEAVLVDTSPPDDNVTIYNTFEFRNKDPQFIGELMAVSWKQQFVDEHSNIDSIKVFMQRISVQNATESYENIDHRNFSENAQNRTVNFSEAKEKVKVNENYRYLIVVSNKAGLSVGLESSSFKIKTKKNRSWFDGLNLGVVIGMAVLVFALGCITACVILPIVRSRKQRKPFNPDEDLKQLMYKLYEISEEDLRAMSQPLMDLSEIAFVVTDIEGSTAQSSASESAFKQLLNIHDTIMRATYEHYHGYEIHTEGDSYQLAFSSTNSALRFCLDVQKNFLEFKWSPEILRLPSCALIKDVKGGISFHGPRIRMAIHWANEALVSNRVHPSTQHRIFEGPAFDVAKELCDIACGGQLLMSHDAWVNFRFDFAATGFPSVEQLGSYKLRNWPDEMFVYHVTQRIGRPIYRIFPNLRNVESRSNGVGLNIIPSPMPNSKGNLTFVAVKSDPLVKHMPPSMQTTYMELLGVHAQHFMGHLVINNRQADDVVLAFGAAKDALKFCHVIQISSLFAYWPSEHLAFCPPSIPGSSSKPLFHGPRIAAAVHETKRFEFHTDDETSIDCENVDATESYSSGNTGSDKEFSGHGVSFVRHIVAVINPGQIVLSGVTWTPLQNSMPPESDCLSLGRHIIDDHYRQPVRLFELLPHDLENRDFGDLRTRVKVEPGYRDAPSIDNNVAIVFVKGHKPELVRSYEDRRGIQGIPEYEIHALIATYYESISLFVSVVRKRLEKYNGYECKEPEAGKFTLAFHDLSSAILWACHIQAELLAMDWPAKLLELDECREQLHQDRIRIHRGLGVKIGMAYGKVMTKKHLITGRADYFGMTANLASKVMALARPGQVLIYSDAYFLKENIQWIGQTVGILRYTTRLSRFEDGIDEAAVEISKAGMYLLRGASEVKLIYQAQPASVAIPNRFSEMKAANTSTSESNRRVSLSRFMNNFRHRSNLTAAKNNFSNFLSHTFQNKNPTSLPSFPESAATYCGRVESTPASDSTSASVIQGTSALLANGQGIQQSPRDSNSLEQRPQHAAQQQQHTRGPDGRDVILQIEMAEYATPRSSDSETLEGIAEKQDEVVLNDVSKSSKTATNIQPMMTTPKLDNQHSSSSSCFVKNKQEFKLPSPSPSSSSSVEVTNELTSAHSDDFIVSFGRGGSVPRVRPVDTDVTLESSDEEPTPPSEYGRNIASLYANAGNVASSSEFSFPQGVGESSSHNKEPLSR